jgi:hypothetical protein
VNLGERVSSCVITLRTILCNFESYRIISLFWFFSLYEIIFFGHHSFSFIEKFVLLHGQVFDKQKEYIIIMFMWARTQTTVHDFAIESYMRYSCLNIGVPDSDTGELIPSCFKLVISFINFVDIILIAGVAPLFSFYNLSNWSIVSLFKSQLGIEFILYEHCPIEQRLKVLNTLYHLSMLK